MKGLILAACLAHNSAYPITYVHTVEVLEINHFGQSGNQIIVWQTYPDGERHCTYWEMCPCDAAQRTAWGDYWFWYRLDNGDWLRAAECDEVWSDIDREIADREHVPPEKRKGLE